MPLRAVSLTRGLYRALLERGAWPLVRVAASEFAPEFYRAATESQLDSIAPLELTEAEQADCFVGIEAPGNTRALAGVDPALITRATRASLAAREARLASRWCRTVWPTPALAQQASMGDDEYAAFVAGALLLDRPDPIAAWRALSERQESLVQRLQQTDEVRIQSEATDLRLSVKGRTWINSDGRHNMPSGEVFTGPHETSANGTITFDVPSGARGLEVEGVELTFRDGEVVDARATRGDAYLQQALSDRLRLPLPRRAGYRHQRGHPASDRSDPLGREDRRHRPPCPGEVVSPDGGPKRLRPALGPDLRPARRGAAQRRRRTAARERCAGDVSERPQGGCRSATRGSEGLWPRPAAIVGRRRPPGRPRAQYLLDDLDSERCPKRLPSTT